MALLRRFRLSSAYSATMLQFGQLTTMVDGTLSDSSLALAVWDSGVAKLHDNLGSENFSNIFQSVECKVLINGFYSF